jgi:hypothetical protein
MVGRGEKGRAAGRVPPVLELGVREDSAADGPEGATDCEPLGARDEGEEDGGLGS